MHKKIAAMTSSFAIIVAGFPSGVLAQTYGGEQYESAMYDAMPMSYENASGAMFSLVPEFVSVKMNQLVAVDFLLNTTTPVTSFQTALIYDPTILSVASIDTISSAFPYWWDTTHVKESNSAARINLQGSSPLPGISGDKVGVAKITFRAVRPGTATVSVASASVALDAKDRNLLQPGNGEISIAISDVSGFSGFSASSFARNLQKGSSGADVKILQQFLNTRGFLVAISGAGSFGNETEYFGERTAAALTRFQEAYASSILYPLGLTKGTGYFGAGTRAYIAQLDL